MLKSRVEIKVPPECRPFSGMERVALTTSGNLQRVISAYYDAPVHVEVLQNDPTHTTINTSEESDFVRRVLLSVSGETEQRVFGIAWSKLTLRSAAMLDFYNQNSPGLGQFFHHFQIMPLFVLKKVGRDFEFAPDICQVDCQGVFGENLGNGRDARKDLDIAREWTEQGRGTIWRLYELKSEYMECLILEVLRDDLFHLKLK